jgi:hypothetical protein
MTCGAKIANIPEELKELNKVQSGWLTKEIDGAYIIRNMIN